MSFLEYIYDTFQNIYDILEQAFWNKLIFFFLFSKSAMVTTENKV